MKTECISTNLNLEQTTAVPIEYRSSDFHVTVGKSYIVFGLTIINKVCFIQHISDHDNLISTPLFLFNITDKRVSKHWEIRIFPNGDIAFWPTSFYKDFYHDDLFEGDAETKEDFLNVKTLLENEFLIPRKDTIEGLR